MVNMKLRFALAALLATTAVTVSAQDPIQSLPGAYKLQLENEYVKVVRVHYDAGAKLPEHTHPVGTTAYVYLNDSEGVTFTHGGTNRVITRRPVKAGAIRISPGQEETHSVENASSMPSDFLRVVFKTTDGGSRTTMERLAPTDVEFANKQMRVTRLRVKPGQTLSIESQRNPSLRIAIREGVKQWTTPPADFVRWLDKGTTEDFAVTGDFPVDIIKIEFLTKPK